MNRKLNRQAQTFDERFKSAERPFPWQDVVAIIGLIAFIYWIKTA